MSTVQILALAVAAVAVLGMVAVFLIAYQRETGGEQPISLDRATLRRDRSEQAPVLVAVPTRAEESEAGAEARTVEAPPPPPTPPETEAVEAVEVRRVEEVSPEEAGVTRRQFFTRAILTAFGAYLTLTGLAMLGFLWPRLAGGFGADVDAGDIEGLKNQIRQDDGSVTPAYVPEARAYVIPFDPGAAEGTDFADIPVIAAGLTALYQRCVHLGCRVPWCQSSQGFECPCHGSKYNLHGEYEAGPAPRNLDRFWVEETEAGTLLIHTSRIIETPRAARKSVGYPQGPSCID